MGKIDVQPGSRERGFASCSDPRPRAAATAPAAALAAPMEAR